MTARDYFSILEQVIRGAREQGILLPASTVDPLIPESRLAFLSSATATIYIQSQRRGPSSGPESSPPGPPATLSAAQARAFLDVLAEAAKDPTFHVAVPSQGGKGGGPMGRGASETAAATDVGRIPAAPAIPKVPPETQQAPPREGDSHGEYTYHRCPSCSQMKPYKKWWPRAKCWECYKAEKS